METLRDAVTKAIEMYNRYRSPEANAKLINFREDRWTVEFWGPFCRTCGVSDWFEDLIYELKDIVDADIRIGRVEEAGPERFKVIFQMRRKA